MTKKQKKMLVRIIITAVMLVGLKFIPLTGIPQLGGLSDCLSGDRVRHFEESRKGHPQRPGL